MNRQRIISLFRALCLICTGCFLGLSTQSYAHSSNQSIMKLGEGQGQLTGEWWVPLRILDRVLDLDGDQNQAITWREIQDAQNRIEAYLKNDVRFSQLGFKQQVEERGGNEVSCAIDMAPFMLQALREGLALYMPFSVNCPEPISAENLPNIDYQLFFNEDPWHRGYITLQQGDTLQSMIASPSDYQFRLGDSASTVFAQIKQFLIEGVWHIWIGLDHILFLIALLLPAVFCYQRTVAGRALQQTTHGRFMPMFYDTLKIVTAFTVSHSLTLCLAAFEIVVLPALMVEIAIAVSVVISALLLWLPSWQRYRWQIAFVFGFVHGFGFANVLGDLTLPQEYFALCLLAFNLGVELGQLAIVAVVLPLMFSLRNVRIYTQMAIPSAMSCIGLIGIFWVVERSAGL